MEREATLAAPVNDHDVPLLRMGNSSQTEIWDAHLSGFNPEGAKHCERNANLTVNRSWVALFEGCQESESNLKLLAESVSRRFFRT